MSKCYCERCEGAEQITATEGFTGKDDYLEERPPSVYNKLEELEASTSRRRNSELIEEIMGAVNAIDNELIAFALELPTEQAEKLLAIQERLY
ncbi:hypothetical protein [Bacillus wiedmannii]|uniref:hypothetical protein n=1 Tax=Bacillus wiedmannii TaxID=1890302 RepID=UPI000BEFF375|nr:hypothetical protein [Bacillus wiedmannii]PEM30178.1 hypothetical protein CN598_12700 [Bacillus wiedmannii]